MIVLKNLTVEKIFGIDHKGLLKNLRRKSLRRRKRNRGAETDNTVSNPKTNNILPRAFSIFVNLTKYQS